MEGEFGIAHSGEPLGAIETHLKLHLLEPLSHPYYTCSPDQLFKENGSW